MANKYPEDRLIRALFAVVALQGPYGSYNYTVAQVLFDKENSINWHKAYDLILEQHPELPPKIKEKGIIQVINDYGGSL